MYGYLLMADALKRCIEEHPECSGMVAAPDNERANEFLKLFCFEPTTLWHSATQFPPMFLRADVIADLV
jgi:hypothetical protein